MRRLHREYPELPPRHAQRLRGTWDRMNGESHLKQNGVSVRHIDRLAQPSAVHRDFARTAKLGVYVKHADSRCGRVANALRHCPRIRRVEIAPVHVQLEYKLSLIDISSRRPSDAAPDRNIALPAI